MSIQTRTLLPFLGALSALAVACGANDGTVGTDPDVASATSPLQIDQGFFNTMGPLSSEGASAELLFPGQVLMSQGGGSSGCGWGLVMQNDGNLVLYGSQAWWATGTNNGSNYAALQGDGTFVVYNFSGVPQWASNTNDGGGEKVIMQTDGNLVMYRSNNSVAFATGTNGRAPIPLVGGPQFKVCSNPSVPSSGSSETTIIQNGADRPGGDYAFIVSASAIDCANACVQDRGNCEAFSWIPAGVAGETGSTCALKSSTPAAVPDSRGVVTGYIRTRIFEPPPR
jgi:hypothetical protein